MATPVNDPRTMISVGTMGLILGITLPCFFHPAAEFALNPLPALNGSGYGLSLSSNLTA